MLYWSAIKDPLSSSSSGPQAKIAARVSNETRQRYLTETSVQVITEKMTKPSGSAWGVMEQDTFSDREEVKENVQPI